jgi:hypothetical protein
VERAAGREAPVRVEDATVTWDGFRQPHRPKRDYAGFGPFVFDLSTYRAAATERWTTERAVIRRCR